MSGEKTTDLVPPWKLPPDHPVNLRIDIAILKDSVAWLSREVEKLMMERAENGR